MQDVMSVNQKEYEIVKLLGHGKGGYAVFCKGTHAYESVGN